MLMLDMLVIGAGMSGLTAATNLQKNGFQVACVEKARGSGGRLSSKRIKSTRSNAIISFDLGCTSFDAKTELFQSQLKKWQSLGIVKPWLTSSVSGTDYIACPRSSSITRYLADQLDVYFSNRVTEVRKESGLWFVYVGEHRKKSLFAKTKHLIFAIPPQQVTELLPIDHPFITPLRKPILLPQFVLMLNVQGSLALTKDDYKFTDSIISRLSLEQGKPGRHKYKKHQIWVVQAGPTWSSKYLDSDKQVIEHRMVAELSSKIGTPIVVNDSYLHCWRYSVPQPNDLTGKMFLEDGNGIWVCGDYLADTTRLSGVEAAFSSGYQLAKHFHE